MHLIRQIWNLLRQTVQGFLSDNALSHGAAIAYYTVFSMGPVLIIVIGIAGIVFGQEAARGAIVGELGGLMGHDAAKMLQDIIQHADERGSGALATIIGFGTLLITASGVFGQMQSALNEIWKAEPKEAALTRLVRARLASLGLVATLGFLLMVSLVLSSAVAAFGDYLDRIWPGLHVIVQALSFLVSFVLTTVLFAAVYKILPDKKMEWRDVIMGSAITALLFTIGKLLIGLYLGSSKVATTYGAAGSFVIILLWVYYSAQIFLLGAEFTRAYAETHGSRAAPGAAPLGADPAEPREPAGTAAAHPGA